MVDGAPQFQTVWFRSAVDWWLATILIVLPITQVWTLIVAIGSGEGAAIGSGIFGCAVVAAIYGLLLFPVRYGVATDELIIRFGVVRQRIPLDSIQEVYPTRNPLASPALSLNRLAIRTGEGMTAMGLVSPSDREQFLNELASKAGLVSYGERLVRRDSREESF